MTVVTQDLNRAVDALRKGELVAIPTETVYGLAADARNPEAIRRVFTVKGRPTSHPLIVHVSSLAVAEEFGIFNERARALTDVFWPGPLTVVVPRLDNASDLITGGHDTVAIRMPSHPLTLSLLEILDGAVVAPSANKFGMVSPTTAEHVLRDLDDDVALILDGGQCEVGVESTIVDCTTNPVQILRPGAITKNDIERVLSEATASASGESRAPGMLTSHYAPRCAVEIFETRDEAEARADDLRQQHHIAEVMDRSHDPIECARFLYSDLRRCDDVGASHALFVLPPAHGIGYAIRDRLAKAAAPRR